MNKALRYFITGNLYVIAGITAAILLSAHRVDLEIGFSYYGTEPASMLPFSGALLAWAAYYALTLSALPKKFPASFRAAWVAVIICTIGLAVTPFSYSRGLAWAHLIFAFALFIAKFAVVTAWSVHERSRRAWIWLGLITTTAVSLVFFWAAVLDWLMIGQLIFQVCFLLFMIDTLWRYGGKPAKEPRQVRTVMSLAQKGFTIVELMIATTVFSLVLLLCSYGLIQIGRTYNKGLTSARTQEAARSIIDEISRAIQFSGGTIATTPSNRSDGVPYVLCVDEKRYSVVTDRQLKDTPENSTQSRNVLVVDSFPGCNASSPPLSITDPSFVIGNVAGARELIPANMRLAKLDVSYRGNNLYDVTVRVVAGEDDLLDAAHDNCQNVRAGTQFCAVSEYSTVVQKRL